MLLLAEGVLDECVCVCVSLYECLCADCVIQIITIYICGMSLLENEIVYAEIECLG